MVIVSVQMKIWIYIYEDNTRLKLQVGLCLLSTYSNSFFFFFLKNSDKHPFANVPFYSCISAWFIIFSPSLVDHVSMIGLELPFKLLLHLAFWNTSSFLCQDFCVSFDSMSVWRSPETLRPYILRQISKSEKRWDKTKPSLFSDVVFLFAFGVRRGAAVHVLLLRLTVQKNAFYFKK